MPVVAMTWRCSACPAAVEVEMPKAPPAEIQHWLDGALANTRWRVSEAGWVCVWCQCRHVPVQRESSE
jgi:hypothetical protein